MQKKNQKTSRKKVKNIEKRVKKSQNCGSLPWLITGVKKSQKTKTQKQKKSKKKKKSKKAVEQISQKKSDKNMSKKVGSGQIDCFLTF